MNQRPSTISLSAENPMATSDSKSVLGSLPSQRPQRRSQRRKDPSSTAAKEKKTTSKNPASQRKKQRAAPAKAKEKKPSIPDAGYAVPKEKSQRNAQDVAQDAIGGAKELIETGLAASHKLIGDTLKRLRK